MIKAETTLNKALNHLLERAKTYDVSEGERSIPLTVEIFNTLTGSKLTSEQGWIFMTILKLVRSQQGNFKADSFEDLAAYAALACEEASKRESEYGKH